MWDLQCGFAWHRKRHRGLHSSRAMSCSQCYWEYRCSSHCCGSREHTLDKSEHHATRSCRCHDETGTDSSPKTHSPLHVRRHLCGKTDLRHGNHWGSWGGSQSQSGTFHLGSASSTVTRSFLFQEGIGWEWYQHLGRKYLSNRTRVL